ncbi:winged helix-turn-helix domain-containing protein [Streptomyces sp. NPDC091292]|uniref:winged helix-turn-helix domain-containing protein n=1 Tax=Streptomyces sp. NPDC091292 TaxID=3365991 RepID=UPI00380C4D70
MQGFTELRLGALDDVRTSVAPHQGATLLSLVADALGGRGHGVPAHWRRRVRAAAPAGAPAVIRPLFAPEYSVIPDCVTPTASMPYGDVATQCAQLADLSGDVLLRELEQEFPGAVPRQWQPVVERPRQWIHAYAHLLRCVWDEFLPMWKRADTLVRHETERVGAAVVRGALDGVLQNLSPRYRLVGTALHFPDQQARAYELGGRRLVLVPIVSGAGVSMFALDGPDRVWIGYPMPGLGRLWGTTGPAVPADDRDPLAMIVGKLRAAVLRASSDAVTMSELAARLKCSPANITYHCSQLQDAGLLDRVRRGRNVLLARTERGDALVDLLS